MWKFWSTQSLVLMQNSRAVLKNSSRLLTMLIVQLRCDLAILLVVIYSQEKEIFIHTSMFMKTLLTIASI